MAVVTIAVAEVKAKSYHRRLEIDWWRVIDRGERIDRGRIINSWGRGVVNTRRRRVITIAVRRSAVTRIRITRSIIISGRKSESAVSPGSVSGDTQEGQSHQCCNQFFHNNALSQ